MAAEIAEVVLREGGELSANTLSVKGAVTIVNVVAVVERGIVLFDREDITIDLAQVTDVDSSAVSMLLTWEREARRRNRKIRFMNVPHKLQSLMRLYGVAELIDWGTESKPDLASASKAASAN
ncbi:STAS domain-containing protein [Nitrosovibrio tenuis]|uniref:Phospholipid transport system transporter-binding protein n=1 Tax=Nitrosovibrio tenuis TaxID=1233 RepID=A0A1H7LKE2_9PROT|nr:STAS domain-containing protein [Nitrosovibrio tenuis]SEK99442.1 phospholipid transport system transporter-binding protein [Nitrosovibrio tenuis]